MSGLVLYSSHFLYVKNEYIYPKKAACRVCENLKIQQVALFLEAAYDSEGSTKPASPFLSCVSILTRERRATLI